jgi:hypothetical protein
MNTLYIFFNCESVKKGETKGINMRQVKVKQCHLVYTIVLLSILDRYTKNNVIYTKK